MRATLLALALVGCGAPVASDPACAGAPPAAFQRDVAPLFHARCAGAECHAANFSGAHAHANLVDAIAAECADGRLLVEPGAPGRSYLYQKLAGLPLCTGTPMPRNAAPLAEPDLALVRGWICAGAADD